MRHVAPVDAVPWYVLVSTESSTTVEIYRSRDEAERELRQAVEDELDRIDVLSIVAVDLPEPNSN